MPKPIEFLNTGIPAWRFWLILVISGILFYAMGYINGYQNGEKKNEIKNLEVIIQKQEIRNDIKERVLTDRPNDRKSRIEWLRKYLH